MDTGSHISDLAAWSPANHSPLALRSTRGRRRCQPPPLLLKRTTAPSRRPNSPWCGAPTPGRCWPILGVDNRAIEAAFAAAPREAFLGPPPWTASSQFGGIRPLPGADPVILYQDLVIGLDPARGVNNGSPSLHAKLLEALGPAPGERIVHVGAGAGYYSAILAELVGPSGRVTAVEFDAALAERAKTLLFGRGNVRVVHGDGARWPETPADGVYVNFAVSRPADRWVDGLAPGGRLVFPLGVPGPQRPNSGGRHSDRGARDQHGLFCLRRRRVRGRCRRV